MYLNIPTTYRHREDECARNSRSVHAPVPRRVVHGSADRFHKRWHCYPDALGSQDPLCDFCRSSCACCDVRMRPGVPHVAYEDEQKSPRHCDCVGDTCVQCPTHLANGERFH